MGTRTGIMLAHPLEERRLERWKTSDVLVQPKLDGERCRVFIDEPSIWLLSSEGNLITSCPHIEEEFRSLRLPIGTEIDGEIYSHYLTFSQIHSRISRRVNAHQDYTALHYFAFDLISEGDQFLRLAQLDKLLWKKSPSIKVVPPIVIKNSPDLIVDFMNCYVEEGYEGIIVRHPDGLYERKRSNWMMKFKPRSSDIYRILDVQEEISIDGIAKNSLGALICQSDGTSFGVGSGFSREQRESFWKERDQLPGNFVRILYQQLSEKKIPRFPIFAEIIYVNPITIGGENGKLI